MGSSFPQSNQQHFLFPFASLTLWLEAEGYPCPAGATTGGLTPPLPRGPNLLLYACPLGCGHTGPGRFACLTVQAWALPVVKKSWHRKGNTCFRKCVQTQHFSRTSAESPGGGPALWLECCLPCMALLEHCEFSRRWSHTSHSGLLSQRVASENENPLGFLFTRALSSALSLLMPIVASFPKVGSGDDLCAEEGSRGQNGEG